MSELASIIIPAYNAEKTISKAINSLLNQTYSCVEVIVVNDGSTDNTAKICTAYGNKIVYLSQNNQGVSVARNKGILSAKGTYIGFLDADDWYLPEKLAKQIQLFEKYPEAGFVTCAYNVKYSNKTIRQPKEGSVSLMGCEGLASFFKEGARGNRIINTNSVLIRSCVLKKTGGFNEKFKFGEDIELWARLSGSYACAYLDEALLVYDRTSDFSVCSSIKPDQHGLDFLYNEQKMHRFIRPDKQTDFLLWKQEEVLRRLYQGFIARNRAFVADCITQLNGSSFRSEKIVILIKYLPMVLWPYAIRFFSILFVKVYRKILPFK